MTERETFEEAFWANLGEQADANGPSVDFGWLCDAMADTVAEMLAAARREALERAASLIEEDLVGPARLLLATRIRSLAEPERDEESGR